MEAVEQELLFWTHKIINCHPTKTAVAKQVPPLPDTLGGPLHGLVLISLEFLFLQILQAFLCISYLGRLETLFHLQTVATGPLMYLV